ncbi:hypothetical protein RMATCC62417_12566 [Rhizopus microsporus]|nr:hypothetical protein RMATCC62417_12566 [Rhizopus microsporus]
MSVNPPPRGKPIDIEELKRLKQAKKEAKKALNRSKPPPPPPPKPLRRDFKRVNDQGHRHPIRVMSFNILAQTLIKRELFPDSGDVLKWKTRKQMILEEIEFYDADIMSLQEVDNVDTFYKEALSKLGYELTFYHYPTKHHGCAIAFKKEKFSQVKYATIDYNTDPLCPPSILTGNVAQMLALTSKEHPTTGFVIGNTHLYWRPSCNYERLRQTVIFVNKLLEFKSELDDDMQWISLLLGDFNSTPDDPVYGILTDHALSDDHIQDLNKSLMVTLTNQGESDEEEEEGKLESNDGVSIDPDAVISVNKLVSLYKGGQWKSVYSFIAKAQPDQSGLLGEPKFTNYTAAFKGPLDYMFIQHDMHVKNILLLPSEDSLKPSLPNRNFGSDHLCLVADLEF